MMVLHISIRRILTVILMSILIDTMKSNVESIIAIKLLKKYSQTMFVDICSTIYLFAKHAQCTSSYCIQLLESPIPAPAPPAPPAPSQKASSDDISGTKRGTIDPLVSKRPEKNSE